MILISTKRLVIAAAALIGIVLLLAWLLAFSRLFAEPRGLLAAHVLSDRLGQDVSIDGGIEVSWGTDLHLVARDINIPATPSDIVPSVTIGQLRFALDWRNLLKKNLRLSKVEIDGVRIAADIAQADNKTPVSKSVPSNSADVNFPHNHKDLQKIITDNQIGISDFKILYKNANNGLDLDLQMSSITVARHDTKAPWEIQGKGNLNGQAVTVDGSLPVDQPFELTANSDQLSLKVNGAPDADGYASGFTAKLVAEINEIGELLDILKLQKSVSGTGTAQATYKSSDGKHSIKDLQAQLALDGGERLDLTGDLDEIQDLNTATLNVDISLYPPDAMPAPAKLRRDLKLTGVEMTLTAQPDGLPTRTMKIQTNGFVLNTHGVGPPPVTVSDINITSEGLLDLGKVGVFIGPPKSYYVVFDGSINDALRMKGIEFDATLNLPMDALLQSGQTQKDTALGKVSGGFHLSGDSNTLALSDLKAEIQDTDLLQLDVMGSAKNLLTLSDVSFDISADVPSGAKLLSSLKLSPVSTGKIKLNTKLSNSGKKWQSNTLFSIAKSNLNVALSSESNQPPPHLVGQISSTLIRLNDIKHLVAMIREMKSAKTGKDKSGGIFSDVTLEPVTTQVLQSGLDMDVKIDLKKLEGVSATSAIKTDFVLKNDKAQLGPLQFEYDGGQFDVTGAVNIAKHPNIIALKGTAGGWNFGTILKELNIKKRGSGVLNASFNLSGAHRSIADFTKTATGDILISMRNGSLQTRLIDIAGLGVFPWLFSDAHGKVAPIVCLRTPLQFNQGEVAIKRAALETDKVQVVINGDVNLNKETIDVTGEPRPLGKPLSRSPWPFVVSGALKHPKMGLKKGSHRQRRSDGKTIMPEQRKLCIPDILQLR